MPELDSSYLGDCGEVPSAKDAECSISIHGSYFKKYMALEICDIIYVDFHFNQQTYHIEGVL